MLRKLKTKIILINIVLVGIVLFGVFFINCMNVYQTSYEEVITGLKMSMDIERGNRFDKPIYGKPVDGFKEKPFTLSSYIIISVDEEGEYTLKKEYNAEIEEETLKEAIYYVMNSSRENGVIGEYHLAFLKQKLPDGISVALTNSSSIGNEVLRSILFGGLLFIGGLLIITLISIWLSGIAVKPVKKAWQSQKQFIADASHELKTPLTIILANNNIMQTHKSDTILNQQQWLSSTDEEAKHMKRLIDEMLLLAKSDLEERKVLLQEMDLSNLVEEQLLYFEPVAFEKGITIHSDLEKELCITSDESMLKQLAQILIDNAVKYSNQNDVVTVTLKKQDNLVELSVNNHGDIIPQEDIKHIFDRFYRVDKARKRGGYGLGLAIAKNIVTTLKYSIQVESNQKNGTTFTVVI